MIAIIIKFQVIAFYKKWVLFSIACRSYNKKKTGAIFYH